MCGLDSCLFVLGKNKHISACLIVCTLIMQSVFNSSSRRPMLADLNSLEAAFQWWEFEARLYSSGSVHYGRGKTNDAFVSVSTESFFPSEKNHNP